MDLTDIFHIAITYFQTELGADRNATIYLRSRGFGESLARRFRLGYATNGKALRERLEKQFTADEILASGLFHGKNHRLFHQGRIIIPDLWEKKIVNLSGRSTDPSEKIKYLNLNDVTLPPYGCSDGFENGGAIWLLEGRLTMIAAVGHGLNGAVAAFSDGGMLTAYKSIAEKTQRRIIVCPDRDKAGLAAAGRIAAVMRDTDRFCLTQQGHKDLADALVGCNHDADDTDDCTKIKMLKKTECVAADFEGLLTDEEAEHFAKGLWEETARSQRTTATKGCTGAARAQILAALPLEETATQCGMTIQRGRSSCPFCGNDNPRILRFHDDHAYCFACHKSASAIDFIGFANGITDNGEMFRKAAEIAGVTLIGGGDAEAIRQAIADKLDTPNSDPVSLLSGLADDLIKVGEKERFGLVAGLIAPRLRWNKAEAAHFLSVLKRTAKDEARKIDETPGRGIRANQKRIVLAVIDAVNEALAEGKLRNVFWYGRNLAEADEEGTLTFLTEDCLLHRIETEIGFWTPGSGETLCLPHASVGGALIQERRMRFPKLELVIKTPVLDDTGRNFHPAGYDAKDQSLHIYPPGYVVGEDGYFVIEEEVPGDTHMEKCHLFLQDLLWDFAFADGLHDEERNLSGRNFSAAVTTIIGDCNLPHKKKPAVLINSGTPRIGKSKLADTITACATGRIAGKKPATKARDEAEEEKFWLSEAMRGTAIVPIDNLETVLGSPYLQSLLTTEIIQGRRLGKSEIIEVHWTPQIIVTGNNIGIKGDMAKRSLLIELQTMDAAPEKRSGFRHDPLEAYTVANNRLISKLCLNAVREYMVTDGTCRLRLGSFEEWCQYAASVAEAMTGICPLQSDEEMAAVITDELDDKLQLINALFGVLGEVDITGCTKPMTATEIMDAYIDGRNARGNTSLKAQTALADALDAAITGGNVTIKTIGKALQKLKNRTIGGLRLLYYKTGGLATYRLRTVLNR